MRLDVARLAFRVELVGGGRDGSQKRMSWKARHGNPDAHGRGRGRDGREARCRRVLQSTELMARNMKAQVVAARHQ